MGKFTILWEDDYVLVLLKEAGISVTRSQTEKGETVQDQLMQYFNLSDLGIGRRAGIVHRLDKETSGCLLIAKNNEAFLNLQKQFATRVVEKKYLLLAHGKLKEKEFSANIPLGRHPQKRREFSVLPSGRASETRFSLLQSLKFRQANFKKILEKFEKKKRKFLINNTHYFCLLEAFPKTGRTHQIRLHAKYLSHPIVSDPLYCGKLLKFDKNFCPRMFLHAALLSFKHPKTQEKLTFEAKIPKDLESALSYLEND